ncbi:MAG: hypothetical protein ACXWJZ_00060 [Burkholderiaceae bacterium]
MMKIAAIVIDNWKLPIFQKKLDAGNYTYRKCDGVTEDTLTLQVNYEWLDDLERIVKEAHHECANTKGKR